MEKIFNMPWEDRPEGCTDVMWRYSKNPVIGRYQIPSSNSIFNSAVVPLETVLPEYSAATIKRCK